MTVGESVVVVKGLTTVTSLLKFSFAAETFGESLRIYKLAITGSIVHMVTIHLTFGHVPNVRVVPTVSTSSGSWPEFLLTEQQIGINGLRLPGRRLELARVQPR